MVTDSNPNWFEEAADKAFDNPQARYLAERKAAAEAEKRRAEEAAERERQRNRIHPAAAANAFSEMSMVAKGEIPMHRPGPAPRPGNPKPYPTVSLPDVGTTNRAPRPGSTGAISVSMAIEVILTHIKNAKDPREEASKMLTSITDEIIGAANAADPLTDTE